MPVIRSLAVLFVACALSACAATDLVSAPRASELARMPREVRTGAADMVIERVEPGVSRDEVAAAVQGMVAIAPICLPWPGVWLDAQDRRNVYIVRYDLMARDWGANVAESAEARMDEFVDLGFLTKTELTQRGPRIVQFMLTPVGREHLRGSPYGGDRPSFCGPAERRLVDITNMEWGQYPCGSLRVSFTHTADAWPAWANNDRTRGKLAQSWPAPGAVSTGTVSLSRQWFRENAVPSGMTNGALKSICYDNSHQRIIGDDLDLHEVMEEPDVQE